MTFILKVWGWIKAVGKWLWSHPVAIASMVGVFVGAIFVYRSQKNKIASLKDAVEVQKARALISKNTAKAEALEQRAAERDEKVEGLKKEIAESKRRVVEIHEQKPIGELNDDKVAEMFSDAGF